MLPLPIRICENSSAQCAALIRVESIGVFTLARASIEGKVDVFLFQCLEDVGCACLSLMGSIGVERNVAFQQKWHFKTAQGYRSMESLLSLPHVNFEWSSRDVRAGECFQFKIQMLLPPPFGSNKSTARQLKRKRCAPLASTMSHSSPPPPSPFVEEKCRPYDARDVMGNEDAVRIAERTPLPWCEDVIVDLLSNGAKLPLVSVYSQTFGRDKIVCCSFGLPDGSVTENVWIGLNLLCYRYAERVRHLIK